MHTNRSTEFEVKFQCYCFFFELIVHNELLQEVNKFKPSCERAEAAIPAELIAEGGALQQLHQCLVSFTTITLVNDSMQMEVSRFFNRLQFVLDSLNPEPSSDENLVMTVSRVIAGYAYESIDYEDDVEKTPNLAALATAIFEICSKFEQVSLHRLKKLKPAAMADLVAEFKKEAAQLSQQQLFGILMHMFVNYNRRNKQIDTKCHKPTPFDQVYAIFHSYLVGDRWRLMQHLGQRLQRVQHRFAVEQAPVCYALAIHEVSRKGKLKMGAPGEITFSPLDHCR
jgi:hypothetical protein